MWQHARALHLRTVCQDTGPGDPSIALGESPCACCTINQDLFFQAADGIIERTQVSVLDTEKSNLPWSPPVLLKRRLFVVNGMYLYEMFRAASSKQLLIIFRQPTTVGHRQAIGTIATGRRPRTPINSWPQHGPYESSPLGKSSRVCVASTTADLNQVPSAASAVLIHCCRTGFTLDRCQEGTPDLEKSFFRHQAPRHPNLKAWIYTRVANRHGVKNHRWGGGTVHTKSATQTTTPIQVCTPFNTNGNASREH